VNKVSVAAVVFDFGKVLSHVPTDESMKRMAALAGVSEDEMTDLAYTGRGEWDRGTVTGDQHYTAAFARLGKKRPDEKTMRELIRLDLESWAVLNPEAKTLFEAVRKAGIKTAILSNMPSEFLALVRKRFPLIAMADVGIYSCDLQAIKPEPAIYKELISALGAKADELVFFDDIQANVDGARVHGIDAYLWEGALKAKQILNNLGVAV
jgi:putative hydrolase of the HAD superfamily